MKDLLVTWPKSRRFGSYMIELERAKGRGQLINYRVARAPRSESEDGRLYRLYDGEVRGWTPIVGIRWQPGGRVLDPATGSFVRAGYYIVCRPEWNTATRILATGAFRGWRYFDRAWVHD